MKKLIYTLALVLILNSAFLIQNCEGQWVQMGNEMGTNQMAFRLVTIGTDIFAGTIGSGIYRSTNNGANWTAVNNGIPMFTVLNFRGLTVSGTTLFAGFNNIDGGIYRSTNYGASWVEVNNGLTDLRIMCLTSDGTNIFAGGSWSGIWRSTNNGNSWNTVSNGLPNATINSLIISGTNIFAGTYMNGVYRSINNGGSWSFAGSGLPNQIINCLASSGTYIFAGTDTAGLGGVYISTNYGGSWTPTSLNNSNIYGLTVNGTNLFAAGGINITDKSLNSADGSVFLSTNNGLTWLNKSQGLNNNVLVAPILVANNYIFVGTNQSVWRRFYTEIIGIQNISTEIPAKYSLSQNYPNPFNPTSKIKFDISVCHSSGSWNPVQLTVYDIQGRNVATLVNEALQPGTYEATFDASQLTSGVYFYKLVTGNFVEIRKMILMK